MLTNSDPNIKHSNILKLCNKQLRRFCSQLEILRLSLPFQVVLVSFPAAIFAESLHDELSGLGCQQPLLLLPRQPRRQAGLVLQSHSITTKPLVARPFVHISSVDNLKHQVYFKFLILT